MPDARHVLLFQLADALLVEFDDLPLRTIVGALSAAREPLARAGVEPQLATVRAEARRRLLALRVESSAARDASDDFSTVLPAGGGAPSRSCTARVRQR